MKTFFKNILILFAVCTITTTYASANKIKIGDLAPDFEIALPSGGKTKLSSMRGQAVFLHFWATWCPPCLKEMPEINTLAKELDANKKISLFAICVSDTQKSYDKYMAKNSFTFKGGLDADGDIAEVYSVDGIPASILISPTGRIEKINVGMMSKQELEAFVADYVD